ncbi:MULTISPECIES: ATP-binding protein [unclassified Mesobacillus]|uniref:ATP-binding protein n=1 Tax=unclassified Mesobacillus TaxID=2675270 RepID=UPI00203A869E|nr:ATP-binding protein [Mesobacillus sp. MER 33]MCM3233652.1 ATP-binding protein [Mesobacillus sp. MER 48]
MRDILIIPLSEEENLVIASDNSGSIGIKNDDAVQVPYKMVAYYSFRVAVMECISAAGKPFSVVIQNFCGDKAWHELSEGIEQGISELGKLDIQITGSTETNFVMNQSAVGLTVLGKRRANVHSDKLKYHSGTSIAVIGSPLVGQELLEMEEQVVPLSVFMEVCAIEDVVTIPVGSRGILHELNALFDGTPFTEQNVDSTIQLTKSSGPSTCFVAVCPTEKLDELKSISGRYYHELIYSG